MDVISVTRLVLCFDILKHTSEPAFLYHKYISRLMVGIYVLSFSVCLAFSSRL